MTERFVAPLRAFGRHDLARAGGKGANLGELIRSGFPVPDGFVVTTEGYEAVAADGEPQARIAELQAAGGADGAAVRAAFESSAMPAEMLAAICSAYAGLGGGPVAVRSSATAEDLPGAAFAGQQDTYLNVTGEAAVLDSVRRCWGSLWTDRAIAYRRRCGIGSEGVAIAVVVQRMVPAVCAGVMFTANPVTGERGETEVDATSGLGEALVSGHVTPDHYVLGASGQIRQRIPGTGIPDRLLSDGVLQELTRLGGEVARLFGRPQDIEWAVAGGQVWLLQARPMTALPPAPMALNRRQRLLGGVLLELLPARPYPIDMSTWVPYGPAGMMARVARSIGIRGAFEGFLTETDGVVDRLVPPSPHPTPGLLLAPFRLAAKARRYDPGRWTEDPRFKEYLCRCRELAARDLAAMGWTELVRTPRTALLLLEPVADLRTDYLPRAGLTLARLLVALKLLGRGRLLSALTGGAPTRTEAANRALEALAEQVRSTPELAQAFAEREPEDLPEAVRNDPGFQKAFDAFLAEYGHRETASALLVTQPTWSEAPETALGLIKVLAAHPQAAAGKDRAARALEELRSHPLLRPAAIRARLERWVEAARTGVAFREDTHFYMTMPLPILRRSLLEIGRRLAAGSAGVLREPEEVFHLRLEELEAITDIDRLSPSEAERLRTLVRTRSARREELAGVPLINPGLIYSARAGEEALVTGTPASAGTVTGRVCIVMEPADFGKLQSGDILVCPYTNPAWTPLFLRAAAAVVDTGAVGSHAAIVAREYGLPAVMGTAVGTAVLKDGQRVTVDGNSGRVTAAG